MKHGLKRFFAAALAVIMTLSLLPAPAAAASSGTGGASGEVVIDVTDYGADPTGAKESSTAVISALAYAETLDANTPKRIFFPKGEYHFYADLSETRKLYVSNTVGTNQSHVNKRLGILVEDMENVTVDGGGSLFIFHGNVTSFAAIRSRNVTFENFAMDYASPSVIDVTVVSVNSAERSAILYVPPCYTYEIVNGNSIRWTVEGSPAHSGNGDLAGWGQTFDMIEGTTTRTSRRLFNNVSSIVDQGDNTLKVTYSNTSLPAVDTCYQLRNTTRTTPGVFFWESEDLTMRYLDIYFLHGFGVVAQLCKNVTVDHVNFEAEPGSGRTTAGFADYLQMSSVGGKVNITNCAFSNPHDDPINIHGTFLVVTGISPDRRTVTVKYQHSETAGFPHYYPGDEVDFSTYGTMIPVANSTRIVESVVNPDENATNNDVLRTIQVTLTEAIPDEIAVNGHVIENVTYTPEVLIEGCRFVETPTRGVLVTTRRPVVIRNNYFDRMGMAAIFISCDAQSWYESGRTEDVLVEGNTFVIQNRFRGDAIQNAGFLVGPTNRTDDPDQQIHKNMTLKNNTFYMAEGGTGGYAIYAKSVRNLLVEGNRFLRYKPNVTMTLTANTDLTVGNSAATTLATTGYQRNDKLFGLQACKEVTFRDNIYDDGLNQGIYLNGSVVTAADVTVVGDDLAVNGNKLTPAVGQVNYYSSNPSVATVDANGTVTGVSPGSAEIYAYRTVAGRTFESNRLTFTVTGTAVTPPSKIEITGGGMVDVGGTLNLTATTTPNTGSPIWGVRPLTSGAAATIDQTGTLTGSAHGVVEVTASLGGVTTSKLVTVKKPQGLGNAWTVEEETADKWSLDPSTGKVTIDVQSGGDWQNSPGGHNYFLITAPDGNFEAQVKLEDKTCGRGQCWCESGLILYKDHDNYISVVRKNGNGTPKLAVNSESNRAASEGTPLNDIASDAVYLKLVKSGNNYQGFYSVNGTTWTQIRSVDNDLSGYRIGFFANNAGSGHGNHSNTLCEFKLNGTDVPLVDTHQPPSVTDPSTNTASDQLTMNYTFNGYDGATEENSLYAWYIADAEDGHYTRLEGASGRNMPVTALNTGKWVKAVVAPRDDRGLYGAVAEAAAVEVPTMTEIRTDATLASLAVEGFTLAPAFDPGTEAYTVNVPSAVGQVNISATAAQANATVTGAGAVTVSGGATEARITVTAPDATTTKTYTITINKAQSNDATLAALTARVGSSQITYAASTRSYQLMAQAGDNNLEVTITPAPGARVEARFNAVEKGEVSGRQTYPLVPGLNQLEMRVTAEDGLSIALYRVFVVKPAVSSDATLGSLTVDSQDVLAGMTDNEAVVQLDGALATITATPADLNASVYISVDGKPVSSGTPVNLEKVISTAVVRVVAEDGVTENTYTLTLVKNDQSNAQLRRLDLGKVALTPAFDPGVYNYTAVNYGNTTTTLTAIASQTGARITYETVDDYAETQNSQVTTSCNFYKHTSLEEADGKLYNTVKVTVTSPDGTSTTTYTVKVEVVEEVWLSDLDWVSATAGSGSPVKDRGWTDAEPRDLKLTGPAGEETFAKGIGTHANSFIVYDLSNMGFTHFTSKVGVSTFQSASSYPNLYFEVECDGVNQYSSGDFVAGTGAMVGSTPYQECNISVENVKKLELIVRQKVNNNWSAHGNWAEAKLSSTIPQLANRTIAIKHLTLDPNNYTINTSDPNSNPLTLRPVIKPIGADLAGHPSVLTWSSNNPSAATVAQGALHEGIVTGVAAGQATITATAPDGIHATCTVTVQSSLAGTVPVSGGDRVGSTLSANLIAFDLTGITIQWHRQGSGETGFSPIAGATSADYTVPAAANNVGAQYKVVVTGNGTGYQGTAESAPITMKKMEGEPLKADPTAVKATGETVSDGQITGLFKGRGYQYQKVADIGQPAGTPVDNGWTDFVDNSGDETGSSETAGTAVITGLLPGTYVVRRAADDLHEAGSYRTVTVDFTPPDVNRYHVTNPNNFDGNIVQVGRTEIPEGDIMILTVTPKEGYELVPNSLKATGITSGTAHVATLQAGANNRYEITMPAEDVTISAQFQKKTYTITLNLTNITTDSTSISAQHGDTPTIVLKPETNFEMPRRVIVMDTGTGAAFNDFTYMVSQSDSTWREVSFTHGVTCNLSITAAAIGATYTVDYSGLSNGLRAPNAPAYATYGRDFTVTLEAVSGYSLPDAVTVTVGGGDVTPTYEQTTGVITIPGSQVTGNVVITAAGVAQAVPLQRVTLLGSALVNHTLGVEIVPVNAQVTYQWYRVDDSGEAAITSAESSTYMITDDDLNKSLYVKVTAVQGYGYSGELSSDRIGPVQADITPIVLVNSVDLPDTLEVEAGQTESLTATILPADATSPNLLWTSSNEAVATVDQDGNVTGVAPGTVTITAKSTDQLNGVSDYCTVTVTGAAPPVQVDSIQIPATAGVMVGGSTALTVTVLPAGAANPAVEWRSADPSIASVDQNGNVTGVAAGTTTITAVATDQSGIVSNACTVTVTGIAPPVQVASIQIPATAGVMVGSSTALTVTVLPADAANPTVRWISADPSIASVDQNGRITGVAAGTTTITAAATDQSGVVSNTCTVTVISGGTPVIPPPVDPGSGGGWGPVTPPTPPVTTNTTTRGDGSKVTTATNNRTGTVTETIRQPDGTTSESVTTGNGGVTITVTNPEGERIIKVEIPAVVPGPDTGFVDVTATPWAEDAINRIAGLGLVRGTGNNKYSPRDSMTRGALATVLHRLSQGDTNYAVTFRDVAQGQYYTEGVAWASEVKVITGFSDDIFAPNDNITREQLAVMLARYAKLLGLDTRADSNQLSTFADGHSTSGWAVDGMAWCVESGILQGKGQNNLDPASNVTRAEVAVMLDRFIALLK